MTEHFDGERTRREPSNETEGQDAGAEGMQFGDREAERDISYDDVRNRAHEIYLGRGGSEGDPVADWLEAEREVRNRSREKGARGDGPAETGQRTA